MTDIPKLVGVQLSDGRVRVQCDRCGCGHIHGSYGFKVTHCVDYDRRNRKVNRYKIYEVVRPPLTEKA
jgi:hypothetical protein